MLSTLKTRDYRLLWIGQGISHLGDQFHLIALPWLVLTLTHDPLQLGAVLAVAGIPRALLMLVGGVFADRHSPRTIMLVSDTLRFAVTAALTAAILTGPLSTAGSSTACCTFTGIWISGSSSVICSRRGSPTASDRSGSSPPRGRGRRRRELGRIDAPGSAPTARRVSSSAG